MWVFGASGRALVTLWSRVCPISVQYLDGAAELFELCDATSGEP